MKPILYVKGSTTRDVRLSKFLSFFAKQGTEVNFIGWKREVSENSKENDSFKYIFKGGGRNNKRVMLYYPLWMIKVFFHFLFKRNLTSYNIIAINFDVAFPLYLVSHFRKMDYVYEVYDQFAISYNFPGWLKKILLYIDEKIMKRAKLIIHVDSNRVKTYHDKTVIIENTPFDYFNDSTRSYDKVKHKFAVTGLLNNVRGLDVILEFAKKHQNLEFLFVGEIGDEKLSSLVDSLPNITKKNFMPQNELFALMEDCCGIFSLYNPKIEINRLAASNKVYDAMMMGIPVITNKEVINSGFIKESNIGYVVNYEYDNSWDFMSNPNFVLEAIELGKKSRKLYLNTYVFDKLLKSRFVLCLK